MPQPAGMPSPTGNSMSRFSRSLRTQWKADSAAITVKSARPCTTACMDFAVGAVWMTTGTFAPNPVLNLCSHPS
ncbi:hypothetical protein D3C80_2193690 [compost metagenome]